MAYLYNVVDIALGPIGTNVTAKTAALLLDTDVSKVPEIAKKENLFRKQYRIYVAGNKPTKYNRKARIDEGVELIKDWNENMMVAARLLKDSKGKIVCRGGRRFVERVR